MMLDTSLSIVLLCVVFAGYPQQVAAACSSGTVAGIVLGTMFATLLVVAVILLIIGVIWRRRNKAGKAGSNTGKAYENSAFRGDVEMQHKVPQNGMAGAIELPSGYVECKEYESPNKDEVTFTRLETKEMIEKKGRRKLMNEFDEGKKKLRLNFPIHKTGSYSSLDGAVTPNEDPEVISVSLQSQDIIGLGFNISGSMSEGIFVSQVHNRGPASESGQVKVGDRILSITISMTNMVYEDALTILSYASPYAVRLRLQRALPFGHDKDSKDENTNINHPVYRSQSLDDLSKINSEKWIGPRKTWSEIKRNHPAKDVVEGKLRKWMNSDDIVHEEVSFPKSTTSENKSSISNISSEGEIDMIESTPNGTVPYLSASSAKVVDIDVPNEDNNKLDKEDHGTKRKSADIQEECLNINDSGVVADVPPSKKLRDSISEEETASDGKTHQDKQNDLNDSLEDHDVSTDRDVTVIEVKQTSLSEDNETDENHDDNKIMVGDINENKILLEKGQFVKSSQETETTPNAESITDSTVTQGNSDKQSESETESKHEDSVRAVLKDYFGDQPTILEQFGFESKQNGKGMSSVEVTTVSTERENTAVNKTENVTKDAQVKNEVEVGSEPNARKTKDYQYNTGTKGGMAYYLRFDENFYNDFGLFNHEFSTQKEQPNLVPVPIDAVLPTSKKESSGSSEVQVKSKNFDTDVITERIHVVDSDPVTGTFTMEIHSANDTNA